MIVARVVCGGCKQPFDANPRTVPVIQGAACCSSCWDQLNALRARAGLPEWGRPEDAYPEPPSM